MSHDTKSKIAHGIHAAHQTEVGKKVIGAVGKTALVAGTTVLTPVVGATLAPVVTVAAIGYGLWKIFKK